MRRDGFRTAVADCCPGNYLRGYLQRYSALYFQHFQVRLFLYYTSHRILYDEAGRGRAFKEIATGKARMRRITEKENHEQEN